MFDLTDSNDPIDQHLIDLFNAARADATTEELAAEGNIVLAMQQAMRAIPKATAPRIMPIEALKVVMLLDGLTLGAKV